MESYLERKSFARLHGQRFDLETGMPVLASQPGCRRHLPHPRVEAGVVFIDLSCSKDLAGCRKAEDSRVGFRSLSAPRVSRF